MSINLIGFIAPNGRRVMIVPEQVVALRTPIGADPKAQTEIVLVNGSQAVSESMNVVANRLMELPV